MLGEIARYHVCLLLSQQKRPADARKATYQGTESDLLTHAKETYQRK